MSSFLLPLEGLLVIPNTTHGFEDCGWHRRKGISQSISRFMGKGFKVVKHAITTIDALDYPDTMHHFTEESDCAKIIMEVTTLLMLWFTIVYQTWLGMMKLSGIIFKGIRDHKRTPYCKDVRFARRTLLSPIILITAITRINSTESLSFMLNIDEKLQPNTEDVRTEPGAFRSSNYSTNIAQNNSSLGDDLEWFDKARKLRILVPTKDAFHEFVKVDHNPKGNEMTVTGYSVDVFKEVMDSLPYRVSYEFFPYKKDHMVYYDELIQQLHFNRYDGVVGDVTITSNRSKYGDFTLPYMTSGVSMIVPIVDTYKKSLWWFLEPLSLKLWLVIISLFLSKGLLVWIFEHENNLEFKGTFSEQMGKILSFSSSIFVFTQKEKLKSSYSRLLAIFWIFGVFVLVTSYTANLKSMITSDNDRLKVLGIEQLILNGDYVGYQKGSFVFHLLKHLGFQEEKLKAYSSNKEYAIALSRGSCNKGVSAIIEEIPYIKVFLAKYGDRYTMAGPTFGPGGFGFLFHRGCTIVPDISRAVQKFMEGEKMLELEKKWFAFQNQIPQRDMRLSIDDFVGILLITEPISLVALLIFIFTTCKFCKSKRSPSCNRAVEASYIEYFFKRVFIGTTNGNHANEGSHIVKGECDWATPNGIPPKVVVMENDCSHVEIDFQNKFVTCHEI